VTERQGTKLVGVGRETHFAKKKREGKTSKEGGDGKGN